MQHIVEVCLKKRGPSPRIQRKATDQFERKEKSIKRRIHREHYVRKELTQKAALASGVEHGCYTREDQKVVFGCNLLVVQICCVLEHHVRGKLG